MAGKPKEVRRDTLWVSVDECRARLQTGKATGFVDARKAKDRALSKLQIIGSIRLSVRSRLPVHQRNYLVVYCA
jgi:hypothetical protein